MFQEHYKISFKCLKNCFVTMMCSCHSMLRQGKNHGENYVQGRIKNELYQLQGSNSTTAKKAEVNISYGMKSTTHKKENELPFGLVEFIF